MSTGLLKPLWLAIALMPAAALAAAPACTPTQAECSGYAEVNGLHMYYEIHGRGRPLVLIHGGGSTIGTSFGRILPALAQSRQVIALEMQAHGHSGDRAAPESFRQDADDAAELLRQLGVERADVLGFSNGGQTALELGMHHADRVRRLVVASAFYSRAGAPAAFWQGMAKAQFSDMPQLYKDAYLKINPDQAALLNMFHKDAARMQGFQGWTDADIRSIGAPTLVVIGDRDVVRPEHAVQMSELLPKGRLAILPGTHGGYMGEAMSPDPHSKVPDLFVAMVDEFLTAD